MGCEEATRKVYPELYAEGYKWVTNCDKDDVNYRVGTYVEIGLEVRVEQIAFDTYGKIYANGRAIFVRENKKLSKN